MDGPKRMRRQQRRGREGSPENDDGWHQHASTRLSEQQTAARTRARAGARGAQALATPPLHFPCRHRSDSVGSVINLRALQKLPRCILGNFGVVLACNNLKNPMSQGRPSRHRRHHRHHLPAVELMHSIGCARRRRHHRQVAQTASRRHHHRVALIFRRRHHRRVAQQGFRHCRRLRRISIGLLVPSHHTAHEQFSTRWLGQAPHVGSLL